MEFNSILTRKNEMLNLLINYNELLIKPLRNFEGLSDIDFLEKKITETIQEIEDESFIIAFFGAYSDGKSTIIKALTKQENIQISPLPTTDTVGAYEYGNKSLIFVDTPGLFSPNDKHSTTTLNYISQANLIIYVVDAENPIKDSHLSTLRWLLADLNKASSTIFVLNKMDTVLDDLEDEEEFKIKEKIKKDNLLEKIRMAKLDSDLIDKNNIIGISSDPYEEGLNYWLKKGENQRLYNSLSRLNKLEDRMNLFIEERKNILINNKIKSVLRDLSSIIKENIENLYNRQEELLTIDKNDLEFISQQFNNMQEDIKTGNQNILNSIDVIRRDILIQTNNIKDKKEFQNFFELELGEDYYILLNKIEKVIDEETKDMINAHDEIIEIINRNIQKNDVNRENVAKYGRKIGKHLTKSLGGVSNAKIVSSIKGMRDVLGVPVKFKPWQVVKLAKNIKYGTAGLTIGLEVIDSIATFNGNRKFEKMLSEEKNNLNSLFKDITTSLSLESYISIYFPNFENVIKEKEIFENKISDYTSKNNQLKVYMENLNKYIIENLK